MFADGGFSLMYIFFRKILILIAIAFGVLVLAALAGGPAEDLTSATLNNAQTAGQAAVMDHVWKCPSGDNPVQTWYNKNTDRYVEVCQPDPDDDQTYGLRIWDNVDGILEEAMDWIETKPITMVEEYMKTRGYVKLP